jgi:membrane-bound metal-dependent hydrolase YbcI (DUF457 family)
VAIHFGLTVTLVCAAVAYLIAAACSRSLRPSVPPIADTR